MSGALVTQTPNTMMPRAYNKQRKTVVLKNWSGRLANLTRKTMKKKKTMMSCKSPKIKCLISLRLFSISLCKAS